MKETRLEIGFTDYLIITPDVTRAKLSAEFTDSVKEIIEAQKAFRAKYGPSSMEFHKEERSMVVGQEMMIDYPVLVWDATWEHSKAEKFPVLQASSRDSVFEGFLDECVEIEIPDPSSN